MILWMLNVHVLIFEVIYNIMDHQKEGSKLTSETVVTTLTEFATCQLRILAFIRNISFCLVLSAGGKIPL